MPITYWYENFFLKLISVNDEKTRKYKEELFGPGRVESSPLLYSDYAMLEAINRSEDEFSSWGLHARARTMAYYHLKGLVELREHHMRLMKDRIERRNRGSANQSTQQT